MPGANAASAVARKKRLASKPDQLYAVACSVDAVPLSSCMSLELCAWGGANAMRSHQTRTQAKAHQCLRDYN